MTLTMRSDQLLAGLKDGSITIRTCGHRTRPVVEYLEERFLHIEELIVKCQENIRTGRPYKSGVPNATSTDEEMLDYYECELVIRVGRPVGTSFESWCSLCDEHLYFVLCDEKTLALVPQGVYWRMVDDGGVATSDFQCAGQTLAEQRKLVADIKVTTGRLVFANFFKDKRLHELPGDQRYSRPGINSLLGRDRLMQHLAKLDVGYAQMGNMSVTVFVKRDGTGVIVGKDYTTDEAGREHRIAHEGYRRLGSISLEMWRWMCADVSVLKAHGEEVGEDALVAKVKPGEWRIEHFYDFQCDDESTVYSTLTMK